MYSSVTFYRVLEQHGHIYLVGLYTNKKSVPVFDPDRIREKGEMKKKEKEKI